MDISLHIILMPVYTVTNKPSGAGPVCSMTVLMTILYVDRLVTIINDLNLNLNHYT